MTRQLQDDGVDFGFYINPDIIAEGLQGHYDTRVAEAQRIADTQRQDCLDRRAGFSFETVMSHESKIDILKTARSLDYFVVLYFVSTVSPNLNIARVKQRVAQGGHSVPFDRIIARYERTMKLLPRAIELCDRALLFDNSFRQLPDQDVILTPLVEITTTRTAVPSIMEYSYRLAAGKVFPQWIFDALPIAEAEKRDLLARANSTLWDY